MKSNFLRYFLRHYYVLPQRLLLMVNFMNDEDLKEAEFILKRDCPFWAHPVINNERLYIRHGEALMVFKIR